MWYPPSLLHEVSKSGNQWVFSECFSFAWGITLEQFSPTEGDKSLKSQEQVFFFYLLHQSIVKEAGSERALRTVSLG